MLLAELYCHGTNVNDLSPLTGMPLTVLDIGGTSISDVMPLRGIPLTDLSLYYTPVRDLAVLRGMPLKRLILLSCHNIADVTPLQGMALEELDLSDTKVRELGPLRGMRLQTLGLGSCPVRDITALAGMPLTSLSLARSNVTDIRPLRGLPLGFLSMSHGELQPADVLLDLPKLQRIDVEGADAQDLEALRFLPVKEIRLGGNLTDLSPLQGRPLESLALVCLKLTDLAPLEGMPLKVLSLAGCISVQDLRPLLKCRRLERLSIPSHCRDVEFLRQIRSLKYLAYDHTIDQLTPESSTTAEEFWNQYDARKASGK
jgi:Leucine-rich repeat (LRR) protein